MESTLFTTLNANEEANVSGGWKKNTKKTGSKYVVIPAIVGVGGNGGTGGTGGAGGTGGTGGDVFKISGGTNAIAISGGYFYAGDGGNGGNGGTGGVGGTGGIGVKG